MASLLKAVDSLRTGVVHAYQNGLATVVGLREAKIGQLVKIGGKLGIVVGLMQDYTHVMAIESGWKDQEVQLEDLLRVGVGKDYIGKDVVDLGQTDGEGIDLVKTLNSRNRNLKQQFYEQLTTGYLSVDLFTPLQQGQYVMFQGKSNSGKLQVALGALKAFTDQSEKNVGIFVNTNPFANTGLVRNLINRDKLIIYQPELSSLPSIQYYLPYLAVVQANKLAEQGYNVLIIQDDILHHQQIEHTIFNKISSIHPDIINFTYDYCGQYQNGSISCISLFNDSNEEVFQNIVRATKVRIESMADQIIKFNANKLPFSRTIPTIDITQYVSSMEVSGLTQIMQMTRQQIAEIFNELSVQERSEQVRKQVGLAVEPWEKYLLLDSKYFLELFIQSHPLGLREQAILARFIIYSIVNEESSRLKIDNKTLIRELMEFTQNYKLDFTQNSLENIAKIDQDIIIPFYTYLNNQDYLKAYKEDYEEILPQSYHSKVQKIPKAIQTNTRQPLQEFMSNLGFGPKKN